MQICMQICMPLTPLLTIFSWVRSALRREEGAPVRPAGLNQIAVSPSGPTTFPSSHTPVQAGLATIPFLQLPLLTQPPFPPSRPWRCRHGPRVPGRGFRGRET
eukprot:EG_transcript_42277